MQIIELINIFKKNLSEKGFLFDRISTSSNPLHVKDVFSITELLTSSGFLLQELLESGQNEISNFESKDSYPLHNQVYISDQNDKYIVYCFHNIEPNELTTKFTQCLGSLNSPRVFGDLSPLNIKGLLLNIFEVHKINGFIFPSWCNLYLIDGLLSRAMPNICLTSIETELSNPIDFYPDALKTLNDFYRIQIKPIDVDIKDIFTTAPKS